jgi:hypothetical protein
MQRSEGLRYALLGVWERFDTLWYLQIAERGYDRPEAVVFFPLYPLLIRGARWLLGSPLAAALAVSTVSSFFLFWGLITLLRRDLPERIVRRAIAACAMWPASFVLFAGYPESLLLALTIWSIHFARDGKWWLAGACGFFAGLAKAAGLVVAVPLAVLAGRSRSVRALPAALCLLSPMVFAMALSRSGQHLPSSAYPTYWSTELSFPWSTLFLSLREAVARPDFVLILNLGAVLAVVVLILGRRIRLEYTLYAIAAVCFILAKRTDPLLQSTMRYLLVVFPVYPALGMVVRDGKHFGAVLLAALYANALVFWIFLGWGLIV